MIRRYAVAVLAVAVATLVRVPFQPWLGTAVPYLLFFPAIAATAWYAGAGPGIAATLLSLVTALYLFVAPEHQFAIANVDIVVSVPLFVAVGVFISGVTEALRRAERRADTERATLAATLLSIGDGVIVTDDRGCITMINTAAEHLTGWGAREAQGRPVQEVFRSVDEDTRTAVPNPIERALSEGRIVGLSNHTVLVARNGRDWPVDDSAAPIRDPNGRVLGAVLVFREVSARRRVEAEREVALAREKQARAEAEAASRIKDEFLATLSHELRTPLNAILGWSRMLADRSLPDDRREHALNVIQRNAAAQTRLVTDLLDMSRFLTGKMRLAFQPVDLSEIIRDSLDAVRVASESKQLAAVMEVEPAVGPVAGDPDRLRQMVWNLLSNAVKFTPRHGRITVTLERIGSHVMLRVSDTGEGIPAELVPRVFDRFTQADSSTSRAHGGLGLGLALVRQIAEAHGGTVHADGGGAGRGATFSVALPVFVGDAAVPGPDAVAAADVSTAEPAPRLQSLGGTRVLLVEDDEDGRELIEYALATAGADVRAASSVESALARMDGWRPDVILTDIGMPVQDGFALRRRLTEEGVGDLPVIALTGYAAPADRERAIQAGFFEHVIKPVDIDVLTETIALACGRTRSSA